MPGEQPRKHTQVREYPREPDLRSGAAHAGTATERDRPRLRGIYLTPPGPRMPGRARARVGSRAVTGAGGPAPRVRQPGSRTNYRQTGHLRTGWRTTDKAKMCLQWEPRITAPWDYRGVTAASSLMTQHLRDVYSQAPH